MDANQFLAEFGHIANSPGGIVQLRELVLYLAITGKLVSQKHSDFEAHSLLENMKQKASGKGPKKKSATKKKTINRQYISESKIPSNWVVADLAEIGEWGAGCTPSRSNSTYYGGETPWVKSGELKSDFISVAEEHVSELALKECSLRLNAPGDVLIAMYGANIGQTSIIEVESTTNQAVCACTPHQGLSNKFLLIALKALKRFFISLGTGGAQPNISKEKIVGTRIGLPPTEEQSRIVAKVDELMALCDQIEAQQQKRRTLQNHLRQATLQAVDASQNAHELQDGWQRLQTNFAQLFSTPEDVAAFKGLVLDLAASGNLSNIEHRHDSTGEQLLEVVAQRRVAWSLEAEDQDKKEAQTMLKKLRTQQVNIPETNLPEHWTWASLLQVSQVIIDCDHKTPIYADNGIHLIRTTDIRNGKMLLSATKKVSHESYLLRSRRLTPKPGDIFFTREAPMGETAVVPTDQIVCLGQRLMLIRLFTDLFNEKFLTYVIRSPGFQRRIQKAAVGMTVKHINVRDVETLMLPVPPKPEQDAIVTIIDALFTVCDRFEKQLSKKLRVAENLVSSSVASLTGIAIEQEEEPMKAPQTKLVAPVRLGTPPDVNAPAPLATILARHNGEMSAKDLWQRFGGAIDAFYSQLKAEVAHGWILEPEKAEMLEKIEE